MWPTLVEVSGIDGQMMLMTGVIGVYDIDVVTIARQPITRVDDGQLSVVGDEQSLSLESCVLKQTVTLLEASPMVGAAATAIAFTRSLSWSTIAVRLA
jgi:hypothetical protein